MRQVLRARLVTDLAQVVVLPPINLRKPIFAAILSCFASRLAQDQATLALAKEGGLLGALQCVDESVQIEIFRPMNYAQNKKSHRR